MSFNGKDTFSKWGSSRLKSSFGKVANSRFWPVTKILRRFANARLLAAVGSENGPPRPGPSHVIFGSIITKKILPSCRKPYRRFLSDNGQRDTTVCWQTDGPSHGPSLRDQALLAIGQQGCQSPHRAIVTFEAPAVSPGGPKPVIDMQSGLPIDFPAAGTHRPTSLSRATGPPEPPHSAYGKADPVREGVTSGDILPRRAPVRQA